MEKPTLPWGVKVLAGPGRSTTLSIVGAPIRDMVSYYDSATSCGFQAL